MTSRTGLLACLVTACLGAALLAAGPSFWTTATSDELLRGTSDGAYIDLNGVVTPGPQLTSRLTDAPAQVWSLAASADGTLWAGTGGQGRLLRLRPGQPAEAVATATETGIFAIATAGTRTYYATSPDGRVYVLDGPAEPRVFFDPHEKYIWALLVDRTGRLWIGAGNPAVIYRVEATGTGQAIYHPPAAQVVSLAMDSAGRVLAGTDSPGRLYRFDAADKPYAVLDSGLGELTAVTVAPNGTIYAAAMNQGEESAGASATDTPLSVIAASAAPTPAGPPTVTPTPARRSVIFRIDPNGTWESFWETTDLIYDIALDRDGGLFAASGPEGRLYKIIRSQQVQLLTGVDAKQITRLAALPTGGLVAFATANPGRVVTVGSTPQSPASYTSAVRDAKGSAIWGTIRWQAAGGVSLYTRSGNTDKPDDSWSDWAGPYTQRDGEPVRSAPARFLQWKAVLTTAASGPAPQLTSVTVAYLAHNTRPVVSSITVSPPGVVFQKQFSGDEGAVAGLDDTIADARQPPGEPGPTPPLPGRRMYEKGLQTIAWKADDADGDHLVYSLWYRREGDVTWVPLRSDLTDTIFVWDTTMVPDGRYIVRVVASDAPANTPDRALAGDRESDPIEVDNTPPALTMEVRRQGTTIHLLVHAHDAQSPILKLEYAIGADRWQLAAPVDGVSDSPDERYDLVVASEADLARFVVRVTDALQNVATAPAPIR